MAREVRQASWKPRRSGDRYCALACGGGCTLAAYRKAIASADSLVKQMHGSGWRPVVFENLGWHWRAVSGPVQVYPSHDGSKFYAMISSRVDGGPGGLAMWTPARASYFKDPNRAVRHALRFAREVIEGFNEVLAAADKAAGIKQ